MDGHTVTDESYRGKWLIIYFGYTFCPDACPTTLSNIGSALDGLGPLADHVQPLFITVDPTRDTIKVVSEYLKSFDPRIVGLRGTPEQTEITAKQYHVYDRAAASAAVNTRSITARSSILSTPQASSPNYLPPICRAISSPTNCAVW